ncbi:uncharacterized protein LOC128669917 [Plodia interpunctella]|uniref:uncharacterized protein LOC128669917 n=1 Tax=Plodia interpunctella TaxID=58824 RepID=UPI0023674589|nr:uncharacterized protein LOC128669917 [Plodia interpunctella]
MKFVSLTLLFSVISLGNPTSANVSNPIRFSTNAIIHQLFEMMRNLIRNGSEEEGVPVMDPYDSDLNVNFSKKYFSLNANLTKARFTGLADFYVLKTDFDATEISIDTKIIYPRLKLYSDSYDMEGHIWPAIPLEGHGKFNIEMHHLTVLGKFFLKPSEDGKSILIDRVDNFNFNIKKFFSTTQYDDNFDDIFNTMMDDLLAGYINRFNGYISSLYAQAVVDLLNPTLDKFDTWQILATIL